MALIELDFQGGIATLRLNRPQARNALSSDLCLRVVDGLSTIDAHPEARVVLVTGAGPAFCSGADFAAVSGPEATGFLESFEHMLEALARHRLPTIAAIHGAALGAGCSSRPFVISGSLHPTPGSGSRRRVSGSSSTLRTCNDSYSSWDRPWRKRCS